VVARSYIAFALGLFGLNCLRGGMVGGGVPKDAQNFLGKKEEEKRILSY
jgi:hypothetical protein